MTDKKVTQKYKATSAFDVDDFNNFEGLGNENHTKFCRGETVELNFEPRALIKNKMIEKVGGKE